MKDLTRTFACARAAAVEAPALLKVTAPAKAAAAAAADQLNTNLGLHHPSATAAHTASAALPPLKGILCHDSPLLASKDAVEWSKGIAQQEGHDSGQATTTGLQGVSDSAGIQTSNQAHAAAVSGGTSPSNQAHAAFAAAVGGGTFPSEQAHAGSTAAVGGGTGPSDQTFLAGPSQLRLGKDASIARVLASLNQLPIHSNAGQIPSHAQLSSLSLLSHGELPQQTELTQPEAESLPAPPHQANATQLSFAGLGELPRRSPPTQPLSSVLAKPVPQQLNSAVNLLPEQAHAQAAQSRELQGVTQTPRPTQLRAAPMSSVPPSVETTAPYGVIGSLPQPEMSLTKGAVTGTNLVQSAHGMQNLSHCAFVCSLCARPSILKHRVRMYCSP